MVEHEGVPPDIAVEQTPADVIAGRDPQIERAIEVAIAELKKTPPPSAKRPAYPVRGTTLRGTIKKQAPNPGARQASHRVKIS